MKQQTNITANQQLKIIYSEILSMDLQIKRDFTPDEFNSFIAVGYLPGAPIEKLIGRIVQVREEWGMFGSNQIFMRCSDGKLQCHENQWFYLIPDKYISQLTELFKSVELDANNNTYSLQGKHKRKGFIVKSKIKEGNSTPMRDVKAAIASKLASFSL